MSVLIGACLGSYEVLGALGAGGMGEVYRARDTKLGRLVALKVLPDSFRTDPERLARFEREARLLASLNHPHIAAIHGLEIVNGLQLIVMEMVDGETLADRIARGPVPMREALQIATQIAEALEAAHEKGVIHRDLKPANIKVTSDDRVKVLDFGLAKAVDSEAPADPADSPTLTLGATRAGVILGTAAYMAPEQAKGRAADKRSDIWAFGCSLYEMLTGARSFEADDVSETLAAVLMKEPDWSRLPAETPPSIRRLLRRSLEKDPKRRLAHIADARAEIEEASAAPVSETTHVGSAARRRERLRSRLLAMVALVLGGVIAGAAVWVMMRKPAPQLPISRFTLTFPPNARFTPTTLNPDVAISPDGTAVVYVGGETGQLFLRRLDRLDPIQVTTAGGRSPFFSPDGRWIGYFTPDALHKVSIAGGLPITLAQNLGLPRGATWTPDNAIVFGTADSRTGLL